MAENPIVPLGAISTLAPLVTLPSLSVLSRYVIPASQTPEGKERLRAYYEALGRFMDMFAEVETAITLTLWAYSKAPREVAKIAFAGVKIELGSSYIKQFAAATKASKESRDDLENVLQQLGIINGVRNGITHYGATQVAEGTAYVSNAVKAKGEPTVFPISPDALGEMWADLRKITFHLNYNHLGRAAPKATQNHLLLLRVLQSPWLYKYPVPPKPPEKGTQGGRKRPAMRSRQPGPSGV